MQSDDNLANEVTALIDAGEKIEFMENAVKKQQAVVEWYYSVNQLQRRLNSIITAGVTAQNYHTLLENSKKQTIKTILGLDCVERNM